MFFPFLALLFDVLEVFAWLLFLYMVLKITRVSGLYKANHFFSAVALSKEDVDLTGKPVSMTFRVLKLYGCLNRDQERALTAHAASRATMLALW